VGGGSVGVSGAPQEVNIVESKPTTDRVRKTVRPITTRSSNNSLTVFPAAASSTGSLYRIYRNNGSDLKMRVLYTLINN
jgi:hypothetical protein